MQIVCSQNKINNKYADKEYNGEYNLYINLIMTRLQKSISIYCYILENELYFVIFKIIVVICKTKEIQTINFPIMLLFQETVIRFL